MSLIKENRAQTSLEFIMLVGGVMLLVAIVTLIVRNNLIAPAQNRIYTNSSSIRQIIDNLSNTTWLGKQMIWQIGL